MLVAGLVLLIAGALLAVAADGSAAGVDLTIAGAVVLAAGAVLLITGLARRRRAAGRRGTPGTPYRTGKGKLLTMAAAVVYIVSPIDLVPDVLLPVGVVDDAGALLWLVFAVGQELARRRSRPLTRG
ncbi:hypothetical protein GCM10010191_07820 [Actinomadura vinacea]|uniref:DUF1232 domain-containing protein n=1 Tax=Actinomadura vinacea TaxID=115336 RepID=A0ABN3IEY1_9ACTN